MPKALEKHCIVTVLSSVVMVIGGEESTGPSGTTYLYNLKDLEGGWTNGPDLMLARFWHACATASGGGSIANQNPMKHIVVAGGKGGYHVDGLVSVEILSFSITKVGLPITSSDTWKEGPKLPEARWASGLISGTNPSNVIDIE